MLPLPELQQRFASALGGVPGVALPIRGNGLTGQQRLQVYRNNMQSALIGALRDIYPVTERLVGVEFFSAAAYAYLKANPSHSGNIQDYGETFSQFLGGFEPAASLPYLADVAELEWRRLQTASAPSHLPLDLAALAAVPAELQPTLRFHHQRAARVFSSRYPVLSIWEYCQSMAPEQGLDIDLPEERVLFARPALDVYMRRLSPGEHDFLQQLCSGHTFEEAYVLALKTEPGFEVERSFTGLVREEILTGFYH